MPDRRTAEEALTALLVAWLFWLPLPFGSVVERAQPVLIIPPLLLCALAALLRVGRPSIITRPLRYWTIGGWLFVLVVALQLVPLPNALHEALSPESWRIRNDAMRVASLAIGAPMPAAQPLTVDVSLTALHLFRVLAYLATFLTAALLFRRHRRRWTLAIVLGCAAAFQALYGVREMLLHRYAIWGWVNTLIFDRATGTFVNPNHFAHYAAIVLPLPLFVTAMAWHDAGPRGGKLGPRIVRLVETRIIPFGAGLIGAFACLVAILVAQSRGALLAVVAGFAIVGAISSGSKHAARRIVLVGVAATVGIVLAVALIGEQRTLTRFRSFHSADATSLGGRRMALEAAMDIWQRFPIFGSGLGTFDEVVSMTAIGAPDELINHAHDDYAEIAATTGALGLVVSIVPLLAGVIALMRLTCGAHSEELPWPRRAFQLAALTSLAIAMIHALVDFNFFIPANPATLAAIAGAAVAIKEPR
jgi:O-antigen ligase